MTKEIVITVSTPEGIKCTDKEFQEWVNFGLNYSGSINISNPLHEYEFEADEVYIRPMDLSTTLK